LVRPVFTAVQVVPPSVERKTPPSDVPAYSVEGVVGLTAKEMTLPPARGSGVQVPMEARSVKVAVMVLSPVIVTVVGFVVPVTSTDQPVKA
jgi:hypothetical protein